MWYLVGLDEAGRGPLAGPVVAAAVILDPARPVMGLADSKTLSPVRRESLAQEIREKAIAWAVGACEPAEIDELNILNASLLAMQRAFTALQVAPDEAVVDGNRCPVLPCPSRAIVKGDATEPAISAASILAKVHRDREMVALHADYPDYGFERNKGYPTPSHLKVLSQLGPTPFHRLSFAPVREARARLRRGSARGR